MRFRARKYAAAALILFASLAQAIAQTEPNFNAPQTAAKTAPAPPAQDPETCDRYLPAKFALPPAAATTVVSLHISPAGDVKNVAITRSSGNADLDKAALACASGVRQAPVLAAGKPIDVILIGGVFWGSRSHSFGIPSPSGEPNLCDGAYPPLAVRLNQEGTTAVSVRIATDGSVQNPVVTRSSGYAALDQASLKCVASYRYFPATQNGQPVAIDRTLNFAWRLAHPPLGSVVEMSLEQDGSFFVEGQRYTDAGALKAKLAEIASRNSQPSVCLTAMQESSWSALRTLGHATALLTAAGLPTVRFCTVPFAGMH
jgi:TonB family protein